MLPRAVGVLFQIYGKKDRRQWFEDAVGVGLNLWLTWIINNAILD